MGNENEVLGCTSLHATEHTPATIVGLYEGALHAIDIAGGHAHIRGRWYTISVHEAVPFTADRLLASGSKNVLIPIQVHRHCLVRITREAEG